LLLGAAADDCFPLWFVIFSIPTALLLAMPWLSGLILDWQASQVVVNVY
jgi:hypothetical protein